MHKHVHGRLGRVHVCVPRVCKTSLLRQIAAFLMKPQVKCFKRTFILLRRRLPPAEGRGSKEGEDAVLYAIRSCHCGGGGEGRGGRLITVYKMVMRIL